MVFVNVGISELQTVGIRNSSGQVPLDLIFAGSDNTFVGTETIVVNEFLRNAVTWSQTGINSKYTVQLSSLEANGSDIQSVALIGSDATGSDNYILYAIDPSFIGLKTNSFTAQVEGEIIIRRPV